MTKSLPIDHHFTPIFYLNAWAGVDGRVIRYSRPRDVVVAKSNAPSRTGSEANLYSLQGVRPERRAVLETDFFQPVDDMAAAAHAILLNGGHAKLSDMQRVDFARFMMSMQHRSPFSLGELERLADKTMRETMQRDDGEFDKLRKAGDPDNIYEWTLKHEPHVIANLHKKFLPQLIDSASRESI